MLSGEDVDRFYTFIVDYEYDGSTWSIDVTATSAEDAMARLKAATTGFVFGNVVPAASEESARAA